jgi:hypothetical protein
MPHVQIGMISVVTFYLSVILHSEFFIYFYFVGWVGGSEVLEVYK